MSPAGPVAASAPRVAVDATPLLGRRTGIGVSVAGMLRELGSRRSVELIGYGLTGTGWHLLHEVLPRGVRSARRAPMPAGPLILAWSHLALPPVELWTGTVEVVHGTNFVLPPSWGKAASLVTVWDLTAVRFPELCAPSSLRYPELVRRAARRGAFLHAPSATVAAEAAEHFGVPSERIRVIPPGVDPPSQASSDPPQAGPPYVLALGTVEPRKDLLVLVEAFDLLAGETADVELRIAGPEGWGSEELEAALAGARHRDRIHRLGWVPERSALLAGATVLAYPSRYEGFGLPPLEAMAAGVPVVATAVGSLPEVLGAAALLVPPGDAEALAGALSVAITDSDRRARLIEAGRERAARYSWERSAEAMEALYLELAGA